MSEEVGNVEVNRTIFCLDKSSNLPVQIEHNPNSHCSSTVKRHPANVFYTTTYHDYGHYEPPADSDLRKRFFGKPQRFGQEQFIRGMYRNRSLNM
ncbi:uncharacterized protein LOC126842700 [Adelges cooleyi]|uniref:uncharacterized protein LOC126842700 n=1 Tax=Adelges cooleyi TaxID=133065 RepID=UPI00217F3242|nr:uncharacterized protein LOC126842700 [Adelges cooleyi]